jgi:hypothetical protein
MNVITAAAVEKLNYKALQDLKRNLTPSRAGHRLSQGPAEGGRALHRLMPAMSKMHVA